jgi:hypothetical protein
VAIPAIHTYAYIVQIYVHIYAYIVQIYAYIVHRWGTIEDSVSVDL